MALVIQAWLLVIGIIAVQATTGSDLEYNCMPDNGDKVFPKEVCYIQHCAKAIEGQIKEELNAAFKYMYMGIRFGQYTVDRPGIAKFLMEAATEERSHAILMLDYLNTRGINLSTSLSFSFQFKNYTVYLKNMMYRDALKEALNMEIEVTKLIYDVVSACGNDFHGADVFTNPILDEQHKGVRKLQGALRAFDDLSENYTGENAVLAEYIFDQKMLSGEFLS
uniref:Ferritin n=1 Tax=Procambarus clarkii TaxID=6728 RepID=A0A3S9JP60_PROCL|nr:ferritin [Procambarus clarkii]